MTHTRKFDISTIANFVDMERNVDEIISRLESIAFTYAITQLIDNTDSEAGQNVSLLRDMIEVFCGVKPIQS